MKKILKSKLFIGSFLFIYFSFFFLTIYILEIKSSGFSVGSWDYGFPFIYYHSHCFGGGYHWSGLLGNILFAGILGGAVGVIFTSFWLNQLIPFVQKIRSEEFRSKWYLG